ncbi:hypothetical protein PoMZ_03560 [Pyricularia oryzae]|uniref:Uncharacterized protein n=1 Tax=Pyricularia oryzae TaxID=318829 RepID=A0A4P7ND22_PYROR|nr:hypothetical protein PoMZ_03560 [Pyricularia oryzae]
MNNVSGHSLSYGGSSLKLSSGGLDMCSPLALPSMPDQAGPLVRQPSWSRTSQQRLGWNHARILFVEDVE